MWIHTSWGPGREAHLGAPQPGELCIQGGDITGRGREVRLRCRDLVDGWRGGAYYPGTTIAAGSSAAPGSKAPLLFGCVVESVVCVGHGFSLHHIHHSGTPHKQVQNGRELPIFRSKGDGRLWEL